MSQFGFFHSGAEHRFPLKHILKVDGLSFRLYKKFMPELPEVETVRRDLVHILNLPTRILNVQLNRKDLRFPFPPHFSERLIGNCLEAIERKGKTLVFVFGDGLKVIGHLGMSGKIVAESPSMKPSEKHTHMVWTFENGKEIYYIDPRRFGFFVFANNKNFGNQNPSVKSSSVDVEAYSGFLERLGPDALSMNSNECREVYEKVRVSKRTVRALLLDQGVLSGLGNIYVAEVLFASGLHPDVLGMEIGVHLFETLVCEIKRILSEALEQRGTTLRDYRRPDGSQGKFVKRLKVYGREGESCFVCKTEIKHETVGGRSSFWCPQCQAKRKRQR